MSLLKRDALQLNGSFSAIKKTRIEQRLCTRASSDADVITKEMDDLALRSQQAVGWLTPAAKFSFPEDSFNFAIMYNCNVVVDKPRL
jgi:hypothetical protein